MSKQPTGARKIRAIRSSENKGQEVIFISERTARNKDFLKKYNIRIVDEDYIPNQNRADEKKTNRAFEQVENKDLPQAPEKTSETPAFAAKTRKSTQTK